MRRTRVILTLALGGLAAAYGALVLLDLTARHDLRTSQAIVLPAHGALRLDTGAGDVSVEAGSGPPRIEATSERGLFGGGEVTIERGAGGRVAVRAPCPFPGSVFACSTSLRLVVPGGTAVKATAGSGNITVRGLHGGVTAGTGSGDIELDDVGGPAVSADTGSGDVTGLGVATRRLQAKTGSGDVELVATGALDDVLVQTGSGNAALTVPDAVYAVSADTGSGDKSVSVRTDPASARRLRVRTGSGDLELRAGGG